jgi:hypothetical protein
MRTHAGGNLYPIPLVADPDWQVRWRLAHNQSAPLDILERLMRDSRPNVAREAADNPNVPSSTRAMWQLAHDVSGTVRNSPREGDCYLDSSTGDSWRYTGGAWVKQ